MTITRFDITPDVSLLRKSGEVNYKVPQAVAELIDNPIDERVIGRVLHVEVRVGQKSGEKFLTVQDDAVGMTQAEAVAAMTMAKSSKSGDKIGEFGLGLKTATSFLGAHVEVITCTEDEETASRIVYDEEEFLNRGTWEIDVETLDEKPFPHGTLIKITQPKVNLYAGLKNTMLENFGKTFRHFIASGEVVISVNGDDAEPYVPETIPEYDTELSFEVNGKLVRGWAGLMPKSSAKGKYGFDLVRHNRVMSEHQAIGFNRAAALGRFVGELHLDDFPVTNNKTAFRVDTEEWAEFTKRVREEINDLLRESRRMANPGKAMTPKDKAEVEEHIDKVKEAIADQAMMSDLDRRALDNELADDLSDGPVPFDLPGSSDGDDDTEDEDATEDGAQGTSPRQPTSVTRHRLNRLKTNLRNIRIEHEVARLGRDSAYKIWDIEGVGNHKSLMVTSNADHPFFEVIGDGLLLWIKHNIVEAVAEYITRETAQTDAMLLLKSDILKHIGRIDLKVLEEKPGDDEEVEETA